MRYGLLARLASLCLICGLAGQARSQPPEPTAPPAAKPLADSASPTDLTAQEPTRPAGTPAQDPTRPTTPPTGDRGTTARPPTTGQPTAQAPSTTPQQDPTQLANLPDSNPPEMLGDILGRPFIRFITIRTGPPGQGQVQRIPIVVPGRSLKLGENESPRPLDRAYFTYNYYDNLFESQNRQLGGIFNNLRQHRYSFGIEKSFMCGLFSVGLRQPFGTLDKDVQLPPVDAPPGTFAPLFGSETDLGDLSLILKMAPYINPETGDTLSFGLAITFPTGDSEDPLHAASLQPFVGYIVSFGDWFIQGFTAVDIPTESDDATFLYNDIGLGYFLFRNPDPYAFLTAVVPTVEAHINTPLTERGGIEPAPPPLFARIGSKDSVDITAGVNVELWRSLRIATGVVVPVTGPQPFDVEATVQVSWRF